MSLPSNADDPKHQNWKYPADPWYGVNPRGAWEYDDYDGESLHVWSAGEGGDIWIDKKGQGPVLVRAEDVQIIISALKELGPAGG